MKELDLIVIGAGPAGSTCAALTAAAGRSVLLLEAARFPRDKVCGDCLNPKVWPVLESLGIRELVLALPSSSPRTIRFSAADHGSVDIPLPPDHGELVVRRRELDALLAECAIRRGATFRDASPVAVLRHVSGSWEVTTSYGETFRGRRVVAADGRNSVAARQLRMLPPARIDSRIGLQTHIPHPPGYDGALEMRLYRNGYGGLADLGSGLANLCLVANAGAMKELRKEAEAYYPVGSAIVWRSITPIGKPPAKRLAMDGVFLCGDAARVVEPFTGEGIGLALRTGALLSSVLTMGGESTPRLLEKTYERSHKALYGRGLGVNRLTRFLSNRPAFARMFAPMLIRHPILLKHLTSKVVTG